MAVAAVDEDEVARLTELLEAAKVKAAASLVETERLTTLVEATTSYEGQWEHGQGKQKVAGATTSYEGVWEHGQGSSRSSAERPSWACHSCPS